jgi:cytochrome c peroxidase
MTDQQKRGGVLFFGKAGCVSCHAVGGAANEMFSDFENHVLGVPQIAPVFGISTGNVVFDGSGEDEDFGQEQISGDSQDRYKFRTSPLRNVALQPAFFHNGAFTRLEDAIVHHLDVVQSATSYDPVAAGVDPDLSLRLGPVQPVLARLDPLVAQPLSLTPQEIQDLVAFVRDGLLDPKARPEKLCKLMPKTLPSGKAVATFEECQ